MSPYQICPCPNPQNLECYLTWEKGLCICDYMKDLEVRDYPRLSSWPDAITIVLIRAMQAGEVRIREHGDVMAEAEIRVMP